MKLFTLQHIPNNYRTYLIESSDVTGKSFQKPAFFRQNNDTDARVVTNVTGEDVLKSTIKKIYRQFAKGALGSKLNYNLNNENLEFLVKEVSKLGYMDRSKFIHEFFRKELQESSLRRDK